MTQTNPSRPTRRACLGLGLGVAAPALLSGCASPSLADHAGQTPVLDLRRYFNGPVRAHGVFLDRGGRVQRRFVVAMQCQWQGELGTLDERFTYSDGQLERRVWRITHLGQGRYSGQADDVVGTAQGEALGNALRWAYTLRLPVDGRQWEVQFDDWMYQLDDEVMLNRATMSKWGVRLGEVQLAFRRGPAPA